MRAYKIKRVIVISIEKRNVYKINEADVFTAYVFMEKGLAIFYVVYNRAMFFIALKEGEFNYV